MTETELRENLDRLEKILIKRQKESDAALVESLHVRVLQIIRLGEKDSMMPTDVAQLIVNDLAKEIRSQP